MTLCSENFTLGIYAKTSNKFIRLQSNTVSGTIGKYYEKYFINKGVKNCILKPVYHFKENPEDAERNQSFNNLVKNNLIDLYFNAEDLGFTNEHYENSMVVNLNRYQVAQILAKPKKMDRTDFSSFLIDNQILLIIMLIGYLMTLLAMNGILLQTVYRKIIRRFKLLSFQLFFCSAEKIRILNSKIALILIFFSFFVFINLNLLNNSIKTNVVIVNTDEFIDSLSKLNRTTKTPVFHKGSNDFVMKKFEKLKKTAIFIKPKTIGIKKLAEILDKKMNSYYFFMNKVVLYITLYYISLDLNKSDYHIYKKEFNYYESFKVFYFRKNLEEKKKRILNKRIIESFEKGFFQDMFGAMERDFYHLARSKIKIYFNLDDFINDYAQSNGQTIVFDNYKSLFSLFFHAQASIFIVFLIFLIFNYGHKISIEYFKRKNEEAL